MEVHQSFSAVEVVVLAGVTYRQLDHWDRRGLVHPSLAPARGSGSRRRYSYHDVLEVKVIKRLLDNGVTLQKARRAIDCLRESLGTDLASANLVLSEDKSVLARSEHELIDLLRGGQQVFNIVPLSGVVEELDAEIIEIRRTSAASEVQQPAVPEVQTAVGE